MTKLAFNEFKEVSSKQWKQKIQVDLKGADYNDTLIWNTNEGIDVRPFYHLDEMEQAFPTPETQASQWTINQTIFVADVEKSNAKAKEVLERGAETITFIIPSSGINLSTLMQGLLNTHTVFHFTLQFCSDAFVKDLKKLLGNTPFFVHIDIIGNLAKTGNWYRNLNSDFEAYKSIVALTNGISINVGLYQNAGANHIQELAYAIAHATEYLNHLEGHKTITPTFHVAIGSNYFFEIAKLRALRLLWASLAAEYGVAESCYIVATPTKRNKTLYDYNTNMLRTTTECMAAVLGGANTVGNLAYDAIYHKDNEFGERIARNQLLVLKHESYFNKVNNPADGAYYIEQLTEQLADKALELFKDIEQQGGLLQQLKEGTIQRKIKENATKELEAFKSGELVLLGTNKHPNPEDKMKDELELYPFVKTNPVKTLIPPIVEKRLAEALEQQRIKSE
ncbi:methylmalonyl-CoA mutase subunit beta [Mangrovimonas sp. YM274]|uniref:methylmalonyl-CoA mutase subunit beta n=1 Tax=Mangrovimonas sp. YM274 TaxID=3070660 RepID=UPI0027DC8C05|nr:methylmalonyl-CoA mutase subunit beta [Mangrovimonas sp. YM274]WMI67786.1 methylmalonyl-CoA mutase subunit beta [Mangrovimonas sp. YM274]